jgi:hypothetical protein
LALTPGRNPPNITPQGILRRALQRCRIEVSNLKQNPRIYPSLGPPKDFLTPRRPHHLTPFAHKRTILLLREGRTSFIYFKSNIFSSSILQLELDLREHRV